MAILALAGCVQGNNIASTGQKWQVTCAGDAVTGAKRCKAFTFARLMDSTGQPFGGADIPFQVYYSAGRGPFVMAGYNTYPGLRPTLRFDADQRTYTVPDDAGVTAPNPAPAIVARMLVAQIARGRSWQWPEGHQDFYVDLTGFPPALAQLKELVRSQ